MSATGPVLRDIHLPPEPSWWPPAPGWWLLLAVALLLLAWGMRRWLRHRLRQRAESVLVSEFERLGREHPSSSDGARLVAGLSELLRRAARRHASQALPLQGEDWLAFLDQFDPDRPFQAGPGRLLLDGPYRAHVSREEAEALAAVVRARLPLFVRMARA